MARILVIDDENNIRMMIRLALEHVGHAVETAPDGPLGVLTYGSGANWDLVLLDQRMPGMEGLEVLREIRRRNPDAKVIMITAFGTVDLAVDAMKAGARDFLRKPFTADTLRGAVQTVLNGLPGSEPAPSGMERTIYSLSTINGYWIESLPKSDSKCGGDISYRFAVSSPSQEKRQCIVLLPVYIVELVKAHADQEKLPGGDRFWHALCEESLANYLWQHSEFPPDNFLRIEELTAGLRRWIDAVLSANA